MNKVIFGIVNALCALAALVSTLSVNVNCTRWYYQDELDDQLKSLNRYNA